MKIEDVLKQIPEIDSFLTVDEMDQNTFALQHRYPDRIQVDQVGESRKKHPIYRIKIGCGKRKALIFGCPHPNEPIGAMMLEHLCTILCENEALLAELDTTFHIIKCVDPDGLNLNNGWLKGPFTYENYASNFFRPASNQQVEWTFPFHYKTYHFDQALPETKAIMKVIDEVHPDFMYSLHNSSFGGVYWYVNKNQPSIVEHLATAAERVNLPLNLGEPEVPFCQTFKDAIYELPQSAASYDYYADNLDKDPAEIMKGGGCSADYLDTVNKNAFVLICEMPYFFCPASNDLTIDPTMTRKEAVLKGYEIRERINEELKKLVTPLMEYADLTSSCMVALQDRIEDKEDYKNAELALMEAHPEQYDIPCTAASRFDSLYGTPWYMLLAFGMVITAAKETIEMTQEDSVITKMQNIIADAQSYLKTECAKIEEAVPCQPIPIRKLVSVQMESALLALGMK